MLPRGAVHGDADVQDQSKYPQEVSLFADLALADANSMLINAPLPPSGSEGECTFGASLDMSTSTEPSLSIRMVSPDAERVNLRTPLDPPRSILKSPKMTAMPFVLYTPRSVTFTASTAYPVSASPETNGGFRSGQDGALPSASSSSLAAARLEDDSVDTNVAHAKSDMLIRRLSTLSVDEPPPSLAGDHRGAASLMTLDMDALDRIAQLIDQRHPQSAPASSPDSPSATPTHTARLPSHFGDISHLSNATTVFWSPLSSPEASLSSDLGRSHSLSPTRRADSTSGQAFAKSETPHSYTEAPSDYVENDPSEGLEARSAVDIMECLDMLRSGSGESVNVAKRTVAQLERAVRAYTARVAYLEAALKLALEREGLVDQIITQQRAGQAQRLNADAADTAMLTQTLLSKEADIVALRSQLQIKHAENRTSEALQTGSPEHLPMDKRSDFLMPAQSATRSAMEPEVERTAPSAERMDHEDINDLRDHQLGQLQAAVLTLRSALVEQEAATFRERDNALRNKAALADANREAALQEDQNRLLQSQVVDLQAECASLQQQMRQHLHRDAWPANVPSTGGDTDLEAAAPSYDTQCSPAQQSEMKSQLQVTSPTLSGDRSHEPIGTLDPSADYSGTQATLPNEALPCSACADLKESKQELRKTQMECSAQIIRIEKLRKSKAELMNHKEVLLMALETKQQEIDMLKRGKAAKIHRSAAKMHQLRSTGLIKGPCSTRNPNTTFRLSAPGDGATPSEQPDPTPIRPKIVAHQNKGKFGRELGSLYGQENITPL